MKTTKRLNIEYKPDYFFTDMTNINNFDPKLLLINEITTFNSGSTMLGISYCEESNTPYIAFDNIECICRKSGINRYSVFCENDKNEKVLKNYTKIIDEIKYQILFITEYDFFVMGKDFTRFRFKADDKFPYNKKINVAVCVILLSSVFEKKGRYYPQRFYKIVFMTMKNIQC